MTDMMIDPAAARTQFARPAAASALHGGRYSGPAAVWQEAKTVLVTRATGPRQLATAARLVVPIGDNGLAFRVSSFSAEAEQLAQDGRVLVQPGDWRGNPKLGSRQLQGHARLVSTGAFVPWVQAEIEAKYRWRMSLARAAHRMANGNAPYGNLVVLVTVFEPGPLALPPYD
ncbi:hypothetical protein [Nocardia aurantiaca]|uniref:Pyridoxamine 5'-phosphate oxidase putative domain-containing protein n=1 Tax=Nocardia aurantiaca TaxID=2675850 RepID=A0A6I3KU86_9NOCA|nr:hypothetical protein [Nocardia aurantiaca]MTE14373.1 hypothetical protein [Nocardia aurantiaca]